MCKPTCCGRAKVTRSHTGVGEWRRPSFPSRVWPLARAGQLRLEAPLAPRRFPADPSLSPQRQPGLATQLSQPSFFAGSSLAPSPTRWGPARGGPRGARSRRVCRRPPPRRSARGSRPLETRWGRAHRDRPRRGEGRSHCPPPSPRQRPLRGRTGSGKTEAGKRRQDPL